jgi:thioredoxin-related protein
MKKLLLLLLFPVSLLAQQGIQFKDISWEAALSEAKKSNKLIFMDAYATWCGPCKTLEKYVFTDESVGALFNANFINVRFDMEQYPGLELAEKYNVNLYPTLLFINGDGQLVHRGCGAMEIGELIALAQETMQTDRTLFALKNAYEAGNTSKEHMDAYLQALSNACQDVDGFLKKHFANIPDEKLADDANWYLIKEYVGDIYSREFLYVLKNQEVIQAKQNKQEVQDKIFDTFMLAYYDLSESENGSLLGMKAIRYLADTHTFDQKKDFLDFLDFAFGELTEDWAMYARGAVNFMRPEAESMELILDVAWKFYLFVDDKEQILKALNWTKYVLDTYEPDPAVIDTYASLLFKLGRTADAVKFEEQALQLAQSWGADTQHFEFQLAKFKK